MNPAMSNCENCHINDPATQRVRDFAVEGYAFSPEILHKLLTNDQIDDLASCILTKQLGGCVMDKIDAAHKALNEELRAE